MPTPLWACRCGTTLCAAPGRVLACCEKHDAIDTTATLIDATAEADTAAVIATVTGILTARLNVGEGVHYLTINGALFHVLVDEDGTPTITPDADIGRYYCPACGGTGYTEEGGDS